MQRINRVFVDKSAFVAMYDKSDNRHSEAIRLFEEIKNKRIRSDKSYSFTDCTSFILMKEMKINNFFAFDEDFAKAGFVDFSGIKSAVLQHKSYFQEVLCFFSGCFLY